MREEPWDGLTDRLCEGPTCGQEEQSSPRREKGSKLGKQSGAAGCDEQLETKCRD